MGTVPKNFHGKKGRSGRKGRVDEMLKNEVIFKAWSKKQQKMSDQDATQIVLKDMGETIKGDKNNPIAIKIITGMVIKEDYGDTVLNEDKETVASSETLD